MKQNIMIVLLCVIAVILAVVAVEIKDAKELQQEQINYRQEGQIKQVENEKQITLKDGGYINFPLPKYPTTALKNEEEGEVVIEFIVNENGKIESSKIKQSSGSKALDEAALGAIQNGNFHKKNINNLEKTKYKTRFDFKIN